LLFYQKKKAEIAPGVGAETDMFVLTEAGSFQYPPGSVALLEETYADYQKRIASLDHTIVQEYQERDTARLVAEANASLEAAATAAAMEAAPDSGDEAGEALKPIENLPVSDLQDDAI
jgi:hypothetical protein